MEVELNNSFMKLYYRDKDSHLYPVTHLILDDKQALEQKAKQGGGRLIDAGGVNRTMYLLVGEKPESHEDMFPQLPFYIKSDGQFFNVSFMNQNADIVNDFLEGRPCNALMATEKGTGIHIVCMDETLC